jgi:DNA-binding CsgD family transcriptional regulator
MSGPLQVIAVGFGSSEDARGRVLAEVDRLQGRGVLRLLDMLFVSKSEDGTIQRLVVGDDEDFGALLSSIVPLDGAGFVDAAVVGGSSSFDPSDASALAEALLPGRALAFLLVEHGWAQPLFDVIAETGGEMLGEGFLTSAAGLLVGAEVATMEEAARVIAEAQAAEAHAMLMAMAAEAQAAESIAESEAIRAAAAADAVRALITAGLLEEAAVHEAVEALTAAGLTIAAADEAAAASVAEYAEAVLAAGDATAEAVAEAGATVRAASITVAEARVLHYLPTSASFAVIGDKLGISREAARQRAERAYKKLGVHNRVEAVSRARALGLIRDAAVNSARKGPSPT